MKLCSRLIMSFWLKFLRKGQSWISEPHFRQVMGDARPWFVAHWKANGRFSIVVNWTFFAIYYGSRAMRRNVYSSAVFTGSTFLHSNFTWTWSFSINCSWRQKTRDTGLPDGEDSIPLCLLVLTQYRSVTYGRTDGFAVSYTALAKLALRRAVKKARGESKEMHMTPRCHWSGSGRGDERREPSGALAAINDLIIIDDYNIMSSVCVTWVVISAANMSLAL